MRRWLLCCLLVLMAVPAWADTYNLEELLEYVQSQRGFYPQWPGAIGKLRPGGGTIIQISTQASSIANGVTPPATCASGDIWFDTDAASGFRLLICDSSNTWIPLISAGAMPPADDTVLIGNGTAYQHKTIPDCDAIGQKLLYDQATNEFSCGTDQTVSTAAFASITTGSNTTATMTVDSGASITTSGSGTVNANQFKGNATVAAADGGTGQTAVTDNGVLVANGTTFQLKLLTDCDNPTTSKLLYDDTTNAFSCGTDQGAGGGTTFDAIGSGTNTTAGMIVGTGAAVYTSGTGAIAATLLRPAIVTVNAGNSPYTVTDLNLHIFCDTTAAGRTITLPAASATTRFYVYNLGTNPCTINRAGTDTITTGLSTGLTSLEIRNAGSSFWFQSDQSSIWYVGG